MSLRYNTPTVAEMLAALALCPKDQQLDSLAVVNKVFIEHGDRLDGLA